MLNKVALITGTNSGFGLLTAIEMAKAGFHVVSTMRDLNKKGPLIEEAMKHNVMEKISIIQLDITNNMDIEMAKQFVVEHFGSIDILINNAGYCLGGITEEIHLDQWRKQFETNVFGTIALTKAFIPLMRKQKSGHIINIGSVCGRIGLPAMAPYSASKFAIEGFSESLRLELHPSNIKVSIVEPGAFNTKIWDKGLENVNGSTTNEYSSYLSKINRAANSFLCNAENPKIVAKMIVKICSKKSPKFRYPIGKGIRAVLFIKNLISWSILEWVTQEFLKRR